jgi:hypothetical protein
MPLEAGRWLAVARSRSAGVAVEWHADVLERMDVGLNLITKFGPLDLALRPSGTDGYADLVRSAEEIPLAGTLAPTASLADIVRSKEAAGRSKDNLALPALLEHLRRAPDER